VFFDTKHNCADFINQWESFGKAVFIVQMSNGFGVECKEMYQNGGGMRWVMGDSRPSSHLVWDYE
jgi:hypothetical protein